ncbi:CorA family divalent cation transporter [Oscillospiraceae bacterium PP1C4]
MIYLLKNGNLHENVSAAEGQRLCVISLAELDEAVGLLGESEKNLLECLRGNVSKHENHEGFDYLSLSLPDRNDLLAPPSRLSAYLTSSVLVLIADGSSELNTVLTSLHTEELHCEEIGRVLYTVLDRLTSDDFQMLEELEQEISELEEALITAQKSNCIREIVSLRKRLMVLKRYYERLLSICEGIEENENGLLSKHVLRGFRLLKARISRMDSGVHNLRDYVTQVREAYQAQVDINLNQIMKIFTVITAIFLPLTLVVGWYGMNLMMPEYGWRYTYPVVIGLSIAVVVFFVIYFKKKQWF